LETWQRWRRIVDQAVVERAVVIASSPVYRRVPHLYRQSFNFLLRAGSFLTWYRPVEILSLHQKALERCLSIGPRTSNTVKVIDLENGVEFVGSLSEYQDERSYATRQIVRLRLMWSYHTHLSLYRLPTGAMLSVDGGLLV
jgi:hypothetical protein